MTTAPLSDRPILSLVIPTRNRADYAAAAVRSALAIADPGVEVIVEDNSDDAGLADRLRAIGDSRLRYARERSPRSMSENFDAALARARGDYASIIGDDDGVNPEAAAAARWAARETIDAVTPSHPAHYVWPDLDMAGYGSMRASELRVHAFTGAILAVDPSAGLRRCLRAAGQESTLLPRPYCGIIRRRCLDRLRAAAGTCFPGVSPDLAGALGLVPQVGRVVAVDYPLFLPGSSGRSNAGLSGLRRHVGELRDQPHLPRDCEQSWSTIVPRFYSVQTIWAETTVSALAATGQGDRLSEFNVPYLYAWLLVFYPAYRDRTRRQFGRAADAVGLARHAAAAACALQVGRIWGLRARHLARRLLRRPAVGVIHRDEGFPSIEQAVVGLSAFLASTGRRFTA